MVENCANPICISRQFEYVGDPSQMCQGPTGTDPRTLSVATGGYVAGRSAGYENQALFWSVRALSAKLLLVLLAKKT